MNMLSVLPIDVLYYIFKLSSSVAVSASCSVSKAWYNAVTEFSKSISAVPHLYAYIDVIADNSILSDATLTKVFTDYYLTTRCAQSSARSELSMVINSGNIDVFDKVCSDASGIEWYAYECTNIPMLKHLLKIIKHSNLGTLANATYHGNITFARLLIDIIGDDAPFKKLVKIVVKNAMNRRTNNKSHVITSIFEGYDLAPFASIILIHACEYGHIDIFKEFEKYADISKYNEYMLQAQYDLEFLKYIYGIASIHILNTTIERLMDDVVAEYNNEVYESTSDTFAWLMSIAEARGIMDYDRYLMYAVNNNAGSVAALCAPKSTNVNYCLLQHVSKSYYQDVVHILTPYATNLNECLVAAVQVNNKYMAVSLIDAGATNYDKELYDATGDLITI